MSQRTTNVIVHTCGGILILMGVIAFFIPFIPGVVLVVAGIYAMSLRSSWVKARFDRVRSRYIRIDRPIVAFEAWVVRTWARLKKFFKKT